MRVVVFFVSLFTFLLLGGSNLHAGTHHCCMDFHPIQKLVKSEQVNLIGADQEITIIEVADLDLDEDHLSSDEFAERGLNKPFSILDRWYLTFYPLLFANYYHKPATTFLPLCSNPSPIYITQRVLRI